MAIWSGRMAGDMDATLAALNNSIGFDARMAGQDIKGSMAHVAMLGAQGILTDTEAEQLLGGLVAIREDLASGKLDIDPEAEDIHAFVEAVLTERLGEVGGKLHTGRSRNDQVALDLRLYLIDAVREVQAGVAGLAKTLCHMADAHRQTVMPGYTHLQRAQPVTLGFHLMAYVSMLMRDLERLAQWRGRAALSPLGSGALASTTYPLDQRAVADSLGLGGTVQNAMDGVSDRDFVLELSGVLSMLMMHLSRMAEEVVLWCSMEFGFMALDDRFATGSSIMPQKKNPDVAELIRGKTARVYGSHMALLSLMKGLPMAYNKDMQEDKEAIFDAVDTVCACLAVMPGMYETATFFPERMRAAAAGGFMNATDCADYLVGKGVPFREAYGVVGGLVAHCVKAGETLETLCLDHYQSAHPAFGEDVYAAIDLDACVVRRGLSSGPAPVSVAGQVAAAGAWITDYLAREGVAV